MHAPAPGNETSGIKKNQPKMCGCFKKKADTNLKISYILGQVAELKLLRLSLSRKGGSGFRLV